MTIVDTDLDVAMEPVLALGKFVMAKLIAKRKETARMNKIAKNLCLDFTFQ